MGIVFRGVLGTSLIDHWQLLEELIDNDYQNNPGVNQRMTYVWGPRYIDDLALRRFDENNDGDYGDTNDKTYYHCTDAQFSTIAVIADTKQLLERVSYDAYGRARHAKPADVTGDGVVDAFSVGFRGFGLWAAHFRLLTRSPYFMRPPCRAARM